MQSLSEKLLILLKLKTKLSLGVKWFVFIMFAANTGQTDVFQAAAKVDQQAIAARQERLTEEKREVVNRETFYQTVIDDNKRR